MSLPGDDFVYADPPSAKGFTKYSNGGFGWDEQVRAAEWLSRHLGPVVLTNQATPRILTLYRDLGFQTRLGEARRRISCKNRAPVKEVLGTRNL